MMLSLLLLACTPAPTLTEVQADVFNNSCAFSTCHGSGGGAQGLTLADGDSYAAIVGVPAQQVPELNLVEPGDHENSYLWQKCQDLETNIGAVMPEGGSGLDAEHLDQLAAWIDNGALDD